MFTTTNQQVLSGKKLDALVEEASSIGSIYFMDEIIAAYHEFAKTLDPSEYGEENRTTPQGMKQLLHDFPRDFSAEQLLALQQNLDVAENTVAAAKRYYDGIENNIHLSRKQANALKAYRVADSLFKEYQEVAEIAKTMLPSRPRLGVDSRINQFSDELCQLANELSESDVENLIASFARFTDLTVDSDDTSSPAAMLNILEKFAGSFTTEQLSEVARIAEQSVKHLQAQSLKEQKQGMQLSDFAITIEQTIVDGFLRVKDYVEVLQGE